MRLDRTLHFQTHLPLMFPGFDSLTRRYMWFEFVGSQSLLWEVFPRVLRFSPLLISLHLIWVNFNLPSLQSVPQRLRTWNLNKVPFLLMVKTELATAILNISKGKGIKISGQPLKWRGLLNGNDLGIFDWTCVFFPEILPLMVYNKKTAKMSAGKENPQEKFSFSIYGLSFNTSVFLPQPRFLS